MQSGRLYSKKLTTKHGTNLTNSSEQAFKHVEVMNVPESTSPNLHYAGEDDSFKVITGPGGDGTATNAGGHPKRWGHVMASGSRVEVNDTPGSERVEVVHKSGAGIVIDPDGAIYISSSSQRGAGLQAPFGDVMITAAGDIVIKGAASLTVETSGDLNMNIGGSFNAVCENYSLITKNYNAIVDGAMSTSVTNDHSIVIGGIDRKTVAGDQREQTTGNRIIDIGANATTRVGGDNSHDVIGNFTEKTNGDKTVSVGGTDTNLIGGDHARSVGGNYEEATGGHKSVSVGGDSTIAAGGDSKISSDGDMVIFGGGDATFTAAGVGNVTAGGALRIKGSAINASPAVDRALWADEAQQAGNATTLGGSIGSKPPEVSGTAGTSAEVHSPNSPEGAADAEVMDAADIVDTLTSARKYPEYPSNGVLESANRTGLGEISHDITPQAEEVFNEYSGGNQGNANPSYEAEVLATLPESPVERDPDITSIDVNVSVPAQGNLGAKISKYFTIGQLINGTTTKQRPSPGKWDSVVKNGILLANNVLDPIKEKFPDILITSWYRLGSSNHGTGRAIDIVVSSRSMAKHADIARFARDNLPVDQVFLEKNSSGRTHIHLRVAMPGQKGAPKVLTCGDKKCQSKVSGIQVSWLARRAV